VEGRGGVPAISPSMKDNVLGYTALHYASYWGHPNIVSFLISAGTDIDARDSTVRAPELASFSRDEGGSTSLHLASLCGHVHVAKLLLEAGASTSIKNNVSELV
jgi:ankyrin repeat protein